MDESIGTRSAPVKDMGTYKKFGVFAYLYTGAWDGSAAPDFMYNTEIHDEGGVWSPAVDYNWPGKGRKLRFFAYAPYNTSGIVLPVPHEVGYPDFTYNVPEKVQDQKDLLVAASGEMAGDHNAMAPLTFRHTLTAVRFVVGDDMQKGKVTEITLATCTAEPFMVWIAVCGALSGKRKISRRSSIKKWTVKPERRLRPKRPLS